MNGPQNLLLFFGRFHPLLVHLPIGFLILLVSLESLARTRRFRSANTCAGYILAFLVPAALASAACGWLLSQSGGYDAIVLRVHRWLGGATTLLCVLLAVCYLRQWKRTYAVFLYSSAIVLAVTSHFGGALTHGAGYLTRYAPTPIKGLLGCQSASSHPETPNRAKGIFPAVVQPIFQARCEACHNAEKRKGALRVDTFERLMQGGENGPVVVAGHAGESPMLKRLLLPLQHEDHMPPSGKPQLKPEEIAVLRWWIDAGAPFDAAINDLHPPTDVRQAIELLQVQ